MSLFPRVSDAEVLDNYEAYLPSDFSAISAWEKMMQPVIGRSAKLIERRTGKTTGRLLDVGCGYGFFLKAMQARGWRVSGVEISETGRNYAAKALDGPVYGAPLDALSLPENSFDVVTLFYVIEHLPDPVVMLEDVRRILSPGGLLLLRWPNTTPIVKLLGDVAAYLDLYHTPYHLYDFSSSTMKKLLETSGFSGIETVIGGFTYPEKALAKWVSAASGLLGEGLFQLSGGRWLLPGLSKTTTAVKL